MDANTHFGFDFFFKYNQMYSDCKLKYKLNVTGSCSFVARIKLATKYS